jgi:hypothetical protein
MSRIRNTGCESPVLAEKTMFSPFLVRPVAGGVRVRCSQPLPGCYQPLPLHPPDHLRLQEEQLD